MKKYLYILLIAISFNQAVSAVKYPAEIIPDKAGTFTADELILLGNNVIRCTIAQELKAIPFGHSSIKVPGLSSYYRNIFQVELDNGSRLTPDSMTMTDEFQVIKLAAATDSPNLAKRFPGLAVTSAFISKDQNVKLQWTISLRDKSNYVRQSIKIIPLNKPITIKSITFNEFDIKKGQTIGTVSGSPIVAGEMFFAYEHPNASNIVIDPTVAENYALNRPATASDVYHNLKPQLAVDGNYNVHQHWGAQNTPVWLTVDLEKIRSLDKVRLVTYHDGNRYYGYQIETSTDGKKWAMLADESDNKAIATPKGYLIDAKNTKARYIKATITNNSAGNFYGGHIVELEALAKPHIPSQPFLKTQCSLKRSTTLKPGKSLTQSAVVGVFPKDQLRRGFLYYIERERVTPYHQFLHYNSWYDIAYPSRGKMNATECVEVIEGWGDKLIEQRNVNLDSFVFDDGWDDPKTLWLILKENFPDGWNPLRNTTKKYDSKLGVWLSPFGGYGQTKQDRINYGKTQGFETGKAGFSLAGEKYFTRFRQSCLNFVEQYDVNFFKFDGTDAKLIDETEALFKLTGELYETGKIDFISLTVGTWASPFWLIHGDSVWRGAQDMGFMGKGSKREQWITYRDAITFQNMVTAGPLYPLNAFMNQGIAHAKFGTAKLKADPTPFAHEVQSFFGIGTNLQELYISHDLMTDEMWDILAEGVKWSKTNANVLVDTHWIGGDPSKLQIYGTAAWQDDKCTIMLRNPNNKESRYKLNIAEALQLPEHSPSTFSLKYAFKPYNENPTFTVSPANPHTFSLKPFEVLVLHGQAIKQ